MSRKVFKPKDELLVRYADNAFKYHLETLYACEAHTSSKEYKRADAAYDELMVKYNAFVLDGRINMIVSTRADLRRIDKTFDLWEKGTKKLDLANSYAERAQQIFMAAASRLGFRKWRDGIGVHVEFDDEIAANCSRLLIKEAIADTQGSISLLQKAQKCAGQARAYFREFADTADLILEYPDHALPAGWFL